MAFPYKVNPTTSLDTASNFGIIFLNVSKSGVGLIEAMHVLILTPSLLAVATQHWILVSVNIVFLPSGFLSLFKKSIR